MLDLNMLALHAACLLPMPSLRRTQEDAEMIKCLSTNKLNVIQVQYFEMLVLFQREYLQLPKLVKTLFLPEANAEPSAPPDSGAHSITTRPFALKRAKNDF